MRIYPRIFLFNANFQNFKWYFHLLYLFTMLKRDGITVFKCFICIFGVILNTALVWFAIAHGIMLQTLCVITLIITQKKPLAICWQTDKQMVIVNAEFHFCLNIDNRYQCFERQHAYAYLYTLFIFPVYFLR